MKKSIYRGVHWDTKSKMFRAVVTVNGETHICGRSEDDREAAKMRDLYIIKMDLKKKLQVWRPLKTSTS